MSGSGCPFLSSAAYRAGRAATDGPAKCTWYPGMSAEERAADPHAHTPLAPRPKILPSVLAAVGNTPCIRINSIAASAGLACELVGKAEYFSAGGSVKDRIGLRMIEQAEASGRIKVRRGRPRTQQPRLAVLGLRPPFPGFSHPLFLDRTPFFHTRPLHHTLAARRHGEALWPHAHHPPQRH